MPPESCPNCGADVPRNAKACPGCGADEKTGWAEDAYASGLDIPDEEEKFDYDNFVKEEFGGGGVCSPKPKNISWLWWVTALVLLLLILFFFFR